MKRLPHRPYAPQVIDTYRPRLWERIARALGLNWRKL